MEVVVVVSVAVAVVFRPVCSVIVGMPVPPVANKEAMLSSMLGEGGGAAGRKSLPRCLGSKSSAPFGLPDIAHQGHFLRVQRAGRAEQADPEQEPGGPSFVRRCGSCGSAPKVCLCRAGRRKAFRPLSPECFAAPPRRLLSSNTCFPVLLPKLWAHV